MRRYIAIILLGGVLTQLFFSSGLLIDYYVNTDSYKALCENKDKPLLNCDGKCILAQKLEAANKEKSQSDDAIPPIPLISLQYLPSSFDIDFNVNETIISHEVVWIEPYIKNLHYSLIKPPS